MQNTHINGFDQIEKLLIKAVLVTGNHLSIEYNLRATSITVKMCFIIVLKMTADLNKGFHFCVRLGSSTDLSQHLYWPVRCFMVSAGKLDPPAKRCSEKNNSAPVVY